MKRKPKLKTTAPSMYTNVVTVAKVQWHEEPGGQTDVCVHILHLGRELQVRALRQTDGEHIKASGKLAKTFFPKHLIIKMMKYFYTDKNKKSLNWLKARERANYYVSLLTCLTPSIPVPHPHPMVYLPSQKKARVTFYLRNLVTSLPCWNSEMMGTYVPPLVPSQLFSTMPPEDISLISIFWWFSVVFKAFPDSATSPTSIFISPYSHLSLQLH